MHSLKRIGARALASAVALAMPAALAAQGYPASQRGSVTQNVALTEISVTYGRPVARGRVLWGKLVPWDTVWHPGADSATRITFDHDVILEGQPVKAGRYTMWLIPHEHGPWQFILNKKADAFHTPYPGAALDYLRVDVTPEPVSHMESMAIYFPMVLRDEATMRIHWGEIAVPIHIKAPYKPE
ncbi:MAG: DUF2911 domain-containing protein [Gemmatimonadaceae bacterium]